MPPSLAQALLSYGAQPDQLVDLADNSPRTLRYADLKKGDTTWSEPVVAEHERIPRLFIFDGRQTSGEAAQPIEDQWCRRILLRGDPAWVAILRPGRLDVLSFVIHGREVTVSTETIEPGTGGLARFILDVRSGAADLPRRAYLKDLLSESMAQAVALGVPATDAVSLVGWGLFWRFLVDRDLLVGKHPRDIAEGADSWTDCLSTKNRALKTFEWLNANFDGGLLPFETMPKEYAHEVFSRVLGNIAAGATPQGQLRLPTDWDEINFSHVPVGLLSEVYEAFATSLNATEAKKQSIHYTPRHIAEFVVGEALDAIHHVEHPRVLDPAVGAGVFLIAAFRHLVQREWERNKARPTRQEIRRILSTQLTAFDVDKRALRLAQLGLYLTALELDPDPTPVEDLKFDSFEAVLRLRSETDGSLEPVSNDDAGQFDVVVGNPPWTGHDTAAKKRWVANTSDAVRARLGNESGSFDLPDANPDLAFLWRAADWAKPGGQIALVIHARWMFGLSGQSFKTRSQVFTAFNVTGILNGAALRKTKVWPNISAPFCIMFARNEVPPENGALQFVSAFVEARETTEQTVLRVDWSDSEAISHEEVRTSPWALKSRFRGDSLARRAFDTLRLEGIAFNKYLSELKNGLQIQRGYTKGGGTGKQKPATTLCGLRHLKNFPDQEFSVDLSTLEMFDPTMVLERPRDPSIYRGPLLLVRESILVNPHHPRSVRLMGDVAYNQSLHAISFAGVARQTEEARLLQILFQSHVFEFFLLLVDKTFGVERERIEQASLSQFPIVPLTSLSEKQLAEMQKISEGMEDGLNPVLFDELNTFVFDLYGLDAVMRTAIKDTLDTRGPTPASVKRATMPPTKQERTSFFTSLKESLDDVLQASNVSATLVEESAGQIPWRVLSIATKLGPAISVPMDEILKEADESGSSLVVVPLSQSHVFVGLPDRYRFWTRTQAVLLAHDLLGGVLANG
ncbi:HsdM family class I SAM-dependent methyltransferase [Pseudomonas fluorescens]